MNKKFDKSNEKSIIKVYNNIYRCPICNKILFEYSDDVKVEGINIKCKCKNYITPKL